MIMIKVTVSKKKHSTSNKTKKKADAKWMVTTLKSYERMKNSYIIISLAWAIYLYIFLRFIEFNILHNIKWEGIRKVSK